MTFEEKVETIKKIIQYAIDDSAPNTKPVEILEQLLDRMDDGTDVEDSLVPNREEGDLSLNHEIEYYNSLN